MISLNWVKDYIDLDNEDLQQLAVKITKAGVNVEKVVTNRINNLVIGEVLECRMHPDSDHLHVCKVDVGKDTLQIVCGAQNVRQNLKVIVALTGAVLPGNFEIKKTTIRGIESNGMICALYELGLEQKTEETLKKGIYELEEKAPVGEDPFTYLELNDTLYELDVHKHRNNDCYYHIGFAYEIAAILNKKVNLPTIKTNPISTNIDKHFSLDIKTEKCPYYLAKMVTDVVIGESPTFIKNRLTRVGLRPINNVVDISNYVMLEYGQPLHFFDKDKLGSKIIVREATEGEKIITLDSKERLLNNNDIVITNGKSPVCIAGIMGGLDTEITPDTKNILIESAIFDPISIRKTSNRLNLKSEASIRYGKGLNYEYTKEAIERACYLLEKYAHAKVLMGTIIHDKVDKKPKKVSFTNEQINTVLGINLTNNDIEIELKKLDFTYIINNNIFEVTIPFRRLDIDPFVNDIAEEIGRLYGYHNINGFLPKGVIKKGEYLKDLKYIRLISKRLRSLGLNETKTYTLVSPEMSKLFNYDDLSNISLLNPMSSDKTTLRTTIIPSLLNIYEYNKARKINDIFLYEISKIYDINYQEDIKIAILMKGNYLFNSWQNNNIKVDFYLIKGIVENVLDYLGFKNRYSFNLSKINDLHPGISADILLDHERVGIIGRIKPSLSSDDIFIAELSMKKLMKSIKPIKYKEASKYPDIKKDVAFIVSKDLTAIEITDQIKKSGGRLLTNVNVFDVYEGEKIDKDKKSLAFSLTFSDSTRTLNDEEITIIFKNIIKDISEKYKAQVRDK